MMMGKNGKPFTTRDGGMVKLIDLLTEAESRSA
jgi:arginyl-tRNA synthetase